MLCKAFWSVETAGNSLPSIIRRLPAAPLTQSNGSLVVPPRAWTEPGGISEDMLSHVLWALPSACGTHDPFARRDSSTCGPLVPGVRAATPPLETRDITKKVVGTGVGCVCHLNPFNTVVGRESGTQTPGQMGKNAPEGHY